MIRAGMTRAAQSMNKMMVRGLSAYLVNENIPVPIARKRFERVNRFAPVPTEVTFHQEEIGGVPVEVVLPEYIHEERSLLYFHGGAFCVGTPKTHRELTAWLAKTLQAKVVVPDYRLAPEHPYPAAPDDCFAVYQAMIKQGQHPEKLIIGGDSAGGNLALVLMLRLKQQALALPAAAILYSPWVDLRCVSETYYTKRDLDPMLTGPWLRCMREYYRQSLDVNELELSPVHADLSGLPPVLLHVGSNEILLNDAMLLDQNLHAHGNQVHFKVWHELWHVFHVHVQYLEMARQALLETRDFVNRIL